MEAAFWTVEYQNILDIQFVFEIISFFFYLYILIVILSSKKSVFRTPFYVIFVVGGISDLIMAIALIFDRLRRTIGLCYNWEIIMNMAAMIITSNMIIHIGVNIMITVYQLTIVAVPLRHKQLWSKKNYSWCLFLIIFFSIFLNIRAFFPERTYKITNGFCSNKNEFGRELRFFGAFSVIIFEVNCLILSPFTVRQMLKIRRQQNKEQRRTQEAGLACFSLINGFFWFIEFTLEFCYLLQITMSDYWMLKIVEEQWFLSIYILTVLNAPVLLVLSGALRKEIREQWKKPASVTSPTQLMASSVHRCEQTL